MGQALRTEFARAWRAHLGERRLLSKEAHTHTHKQAHKIYTLSGRRRYSYPNATLRKSSTNTTTVETLVFFPTPTWI